MRRALAIVLTLAACGGSEPAPEPATAQPGEPVQASHERMLEELRAIQRRTDTENVFQGEGPAAEAQRRLASLPASAPAKDRWLALKEAGHHELRMGREAEAIAHWSAAVDLIPQLGSSVTPDEARRTVFGLAVAHMRRGETVNCAARHNADSCILPIRGGGVHTDPTHSLRAMELLTRIAESTPRNELLSAKAIWLLNIAAMTVGRYPDGVPPPFRVPQDVFGEEHDFPVFRNVAPDLGIATFNLFGGMVVDDFSGDGRLDVMTSTFDTSGQMRYFQGAEDGSFTDRTSDAGLDGLFGGLNLVQADYDNDGDLDALVLRGAWLSRAGRHPNSLLRNDGPDASGTPTFTDVTFDVGLAEPAFPTQTAAWADYDNDGDVDLYIGNEDGEQHFDGPCQLFRNDGEQPDGGWRFTEVGAKAGVDHRGFVKGVVWGDYDGDDWPDLYVSTLGGPNRLYRNLGGDESGHRGFEDATVRAGVEGPTQSFPVWFFDYDNDGWQDLLRAELPGSRRRRRRWSPASYLGACRSQGETASHLPEPGRRHLPRTRPQPGRAWNG